MLQLTTDSGMEWLYPRGINGLLAAFALHARRDLRVHISQFDTDLHFQLFLGEQRYVCAVARSSFAEGADYGAIVRLILLGFPAAGCTPDTVSGP